MSGLEHRKITNYWQLGLFSGKVSLNAFPSSSMGIYNGAKLTFDVR